MKTVNETFTDIADRVSEGMGQWWVTVLSIGLVLLWLAAGPFFHFSDTWQLIINTPTTIIEMWIGFLIAAATNRVERRNRELLQKIESIEEQVLLVVKQESEEIQQIERKIL